jgi:hypothetical protein
MASRRDQIIAEVVEVLRDGLPCPSAVSVDRFPLRPEGGDRIGVYPVQEDVAPAGVRGGAISKRRLRIALEIRTAGTTDEGSADEQLDPLYVAAMQALLSDTTLEGLVSGISEVALEWKAVEGVQVHGLLYVYLVIEYQTRADDPESRT